MSGPRSSVLDRNLAGLLQRAYRPAAPREAFRRELEARESRVEGGASGGAACAAAEAAASSRVTCRRRQIGRDRVSSRARSRARSRELTREIAREIAVELAREIAREIAVEVGGGRRVASPSRGRGCAAEIARDRGGDRARSHRVEDGDVRREMPRGGEGAIEVRLAPAI